MVFVESELCTLCIDRRFCIINFFKETKIMNAPFMTNLSVPFLGFFVPVNTRNSTGVDFASREIHAVGLMRNISQVFDLIVEAIPINMVNKFLGPFSVKNCPGDSVCLVSFAKDADAPVSSAISNAASNCSSPRPAVGVYLPSNVSSQWVIRKNGFQHIRVNHLQSLKSMCGDYKP